LVLTKSRSDYCRLDGCSLSSSQTSSRSYSIAKDEKQLLRQTGLFQELILLYTQSIEEAQTKDEKGKRDETQMVSHLRAKTPVMVTARDVVREQLLRVIVVMSAQSLSILGNYAARVPELTVVLYEDGFLDANIVDATLWFVLLFSVSTTSSSSTIRSRNGLNMKTKMVSMTLTKGELNNRCVRGTLDLCERCVRALPATTNPLAEVEECATTTATTTTTYYSADVLLDFIQFVNCCANIPILSEAWMSSISSSMHDLEKVRESIAHVMKSLVNVPVIFKDRYAAQLDDGDGKKKRV